MEDYTIELQFGIFGDNPEPTNYAVYKWGVWEKGSVLEGQDCKTFKAMYEPTKDGLKQALKEYPTALEGFRSANNTYNHLPDENGHTSVSIGICYCEYSPCGCYPED